MTLRVLGGVVLRGKAGTVLGIILVLGEYFLKPYMHKNHRECLFCVDDVCLTVVVYCDLSLLILCVSLASYALSAALSENVCLVSMWTCCDLNVAATIGTSYFRAHTSPIEANSQMANII